MSLCVGFSLLTLFPGRVGGTETYVRGLLAELCGSPAAELLTVLANRHVIGPYRGFVTAPHSLYQVRSYRSGDRLPSRALAMATAAVLPHHVARDVPDNLDLIHYPLTVPIPRVEVPAVVTIHDVLRHALPGTSALASGYRRLVYERAARSAAAVVVQSEYLRSMLIEAVHVRPENVEAVYPGIDPRFTPAAAQSDEEVLGAYRLPGRFVLYPANLWPHKNHARLLQAFAATADRELALVLVGQPYGRLGRLVAQAGRLGIRARVRHLGHVAHGTMPALYRRAEALVYPSLTESFGTPPLEAMASGCPVAAAAVGALDEVCGDAMLAFDPSDPEAITAAIDRIVSEPQLRANLRANGLERAACFAWSAAADRHREIYRRVAARGSHQSSLSA